MVLSFLPPDPEEDPAEIKAREDKAREAKALEEKFGIQIPYNANLSEQEFATVADVVAAIERLLKQKS